jgi:DNA-binding PadR family transcriptional regulator
VNTLGYAILGLVAVQPRTGYEITQKMKVPIGYMWTARHGQIYPELARLTDVGLLTSTVVRGRGPHDTKRYSITEEGIRALQDWVDAPLVEEPRSELLLRIRSSWLISPDRALAFIAKQRQWYQQRLASYRNDELLGAIEGADVDDPSTAAFGGYSTLRYGINRMEMTIAWLDWVAERLAAADHTVVEPAEDVR